MSPTPHVSLVEGQWAGLVREEAQRRGRCAVLSRRQQRNFASGGGGGGGSTKSVCGLLGLMEGTVKHRAAGRGMSSVGKQARNTTRPGDMRQEKARSSTRQGAPLTQPTRPCDPQECSEWGGSGSPCGRRGDILPKGRGTRALQLRARSRDGAEGGRAGTFRELGAQLKAMKVDEADRGGGGGGGDSDELHGVRVGPADEGVLEGLRRGAKAQQHPQEDPSASGGGDSCTYKHRQGTSAARV